ASTCRALIERFEASGQAVRGQTGGGVDLRLKDSWDICINDHPEWKAVENRLNTVMMAVLKRYVRKYPFTALAPLSLRMPDKATGELAMLDAAAIAAMPDDMLQMLLVKVFRPGTINLQKYLADVG